MFVPSLWYSAVRLSSRKCEIKLSSVQFKSSLNDSVRLFHSFGLVSSFVRCTEPLAFHFDVLYSVFCIVIIITCIELSFNIITTRCLNKNDPFCLHS